MWKIVVFENCDPMKIHNPTLRILKDRFEYECSFSDFGAQQRDYHKTTALSDYDCQWLAWYQATYIQN